MTMFLNIKLLYFVFRFHWVLPYVNVGDVICGDFGGDVG